MPSLGTINLHGSLLPQYRGAAPINWAIINGEKETGVTTFKLQQEIDTGNILLQEKIEISEDETAGTLHDKMMNVGADVLLKTIQQLEKGNLAEYSQNSLPAISSIPLRAASKIFTETCEINWDQTAENVYNFIRGLSPYPTAFTYLDGKKIKVFSAIKDTDKIETTPGARETDYKTYLKFAARDGFISLKEIQLEGKKRMKIEDFLRGWRKT
jgi:methionyl-tRNA formyltransferase